MSAALDVGTDDGLRHALRLIREAGSWDCAAGQELLAEIRRRAPRNAARIASNTGVAADRRLADDILAAAWLILQFNTEDVVSARRPWSYLMYSAQRQVTAEVKAQQLLTSDSVVRGRGRHGLPPTVRRIGATQAELVTALRHEPGAGEAVRQVGHHTRSPTSPR